MNAKKYMIIIKGEIKTSEIKFCQYHTDTGKMDVEFNNGKTYSYAYQNVEWLKEPAVLDPGMYRIRKNGRELFHIEGIYVFQGTQDRYWHVCFSNGSERDYCQRDLEIAESCVNQSRSKDVFEYIRKIAKLSELKNKETGEKLLAKKFENMSFVGNQVALAKYLNPSALQTGKGNRDYVPVFPFGCNNSQYKAVKDAMENQISVIQGPPGTGKTQTILNIIANILLQGKTVQVVSNNNSATENVYEKLSSEKDNFGFVVATLGNVENKHAFVERQKVDYPDFSSWKTEMDPNVLQKQIQNQSIQLKQFFNMQERLAETKQEQAQLLTELVYFDQYVDETDVDVNRVKNRKNLSAKQWLTVWRECQMISEKKQVVGVLFKIKAFLAYGITDMDFYKQDIAKIITAFQNQYYHTRRKELEQEIQRIKAYLESVHKGLLEELCDQSMRLLKDALARRYGKKGKRTLFDENDLWKNPFQVLEEYPVILSTTFSSRNSLNQDVIYDYLIMDEASQVDIATGALALSCARNVVIVGDTKQLPNVVTEDTKARAKAVFDSFHIHEGYQFTKSFLQSVLEVMPNVTQTLLREHYRCHPKIINFCNQKFYRGELVIMTTDQGEEDVLTVVKTTPGNHARDHYSQRQIDVIKKEIIPKYVVNAEETGIIAPYKNQVEALEREIKGIEAATVHKFQGKEKDTIIISTVDDEISDFADDPYLINVAVSRAKKKLVLVVTGNKQVKERNITDLIEYIQYNNYEVTESKMYSVFDYLYKQYTTERKVYLQKHKRISQYDSENLMYSLIEEILSENQYASFDVICHFPMNMLIRDPEGLDEETCRYAMNPATHIDFLIYNRISKKPIMAIEVDGYEYHKEGTVQAARDKRKNHILEVYGIPLLRFQTNGSGEREKMEDMLEKLLGI